MTKFIYIVLLLISTSKLLAADSNSKIIQKAVSLKKYIDGATNAKKPNPCENCVTQSSDWSFDSAKNFIQTFPFSDENIRILSKKEWGGKPRREKCKNCRKTPLVDPTIIVIHETATENSPVIDQEFHQFTKQWADIGYHYIIAKKDGKWMIHEGSDINYIGIHAGKVTKLPGESRSHLKQRLAVFKKRTQGLDINPNTLNKKSVAIAIQGNYDQKNPWNPQGYSRLTSEEKRQPPKEVVQLLGNLIVHIKKKFPSIKRIMTHSAGPDGINPGEKSCSGSGTFHIVSSARMRFGL